LKLVLNSPARFLIMLMIAVILRCDTFGDPNLHGDESFYLTVGAAMHHGALPYVDVWDRKPLGLFLIYYLIAAISVAPLAYQLVATLFSAATAWAIGAIAMKINDDFEGKSQGALLAGACYLLWLAPMHGYGGQSPIFYNLFMTLAALLVVRTIPALERGRVPVILPLAMLLAGASVTVKTCAVFEATFLGLLCCIHLHRSRIGSGRAIGHSLLWALIGMAPAAIIAVWYWHSGHWSEYWHAMVTSNLKKVPNWPTAWLRFRMMFVALTPIITLAAFGLLEQRRDKRSFVVLWLGAAFLGLLSMPNFYTHYALPLLVPLSVAAAPLLARGAIGRIAIAAIACLSLVISPIFQFGHIARSKAAITALTNAVQSHLGGGKLLVYDGPPQLYMLTGQSFITPLVFPTHLSQLIEKDVSHLSTMGETRRVLALQPGAVVMATGIRNAPGNLETRALVEAYVGQNCQLITVVLTPERAREDWIEVWGNCRK
jgi:hypothetical protein